MSIFEFFERRKVKIPVIAQVTIETFGTMLNGTEIGAALTALEQFPIDVIGMNCGTGTKTDGGIREISVRTRGNSRVGFAERRSAGSQRRQTALRRNAGEFAKTGRPFRQGFRRKYRRRLLRHDGGCIKMLREEIERISPKQRDAKLAPSASSIYFRQPYSQDASFLIVGKE